MSFHSTLLHPTPIIVPRNVIDSVHHNLDLDDLDDVNVEGPRRGSGLGLVPASDGELRVPSSSTSMGSIQSVSSPNNFLSLVDEANATRDGQPRSPLYYSRATNDRRRNRQTYSESRSGSYGSYSRSVRSDTATAHAVKTARYPVLYEKLKAPAAARRALKAWKKEEKQGAGEQIRTDACVLGTHGRPLIEEDQTAADENGGNTEAQPEDSAEGNGHYQEEAEQAAPGSSESVTGSTTTGNVSLAAPPSAVSPVAGPSTSAALVVGSKARTADDLPPQYMTFSEPRLEKTSRGSVLRITCTLGKTYPSFHIDCNYTYVDKSERVNSSQTDTRISSALISTRENVWVIVFEQKGYNDEFIRGLVGEAEYVRLDGDVSGPIRGYRRSSDLAARKVAKKIEIPLGYDLGGIWCKATGFYEMRISIPERDYSHKR